MHVYARIPRYLLVTAALMLFGCSGDSSINQLPGDGLAIPTVQEPEPTAWPSALPVDQLQPWEELDEAGFVIPPERDYFSDKASSMINADSVFTPGVERADASAVGVSENGEALSLSSGSAGSGALSYAIYDIPLGGIEPGAISADVNLIGTTSGNSYYLGLADYGRGRWEWHGPFTDNHVRIGTAQEVAGGASYMSSLGGVFVCVVAFDGASCDVVGIGVNPINLGDTTAPSAPTGLTLSPVSGGLELSWNGVAAADLVGYRVYYATHWFYSDANPGVHSVGILEGKTRYFLTGLSDTSHVRVRVSAVDLSGNESELSDLEFALPLAGEPPELHLTCSAPSGLTGEVITLTASGADSYDWDLDGDGIFELPDASGTQQVPTGTAGIIRPAVRGVSGNGCVACGGVSVLIGTNSRPVADAHVTPSSGYAPLNATFTGTGEDDDGTIAQYSWDFEDDGTYDYTHATEPNPPVHVYNTPGMYNAKFRVEDDLGSWDVDTVAVNVSVPLNIPPTAALAIGPGEEAGNPPHEVNFDASGSTDLDGTIVEYLWDFDGDGDYDEWTTSATIAHEYTVGGSHDPVVCVIDDGYARDTATVNIDVNVAPTADLTSDVTEGGAPLTVNFDGTGSSDTDGTIDDYEWDLDGDGVFNETGDEADARGNDTASYTYNYSGYFMAKLRVTDSDGLEDTAMLAITARGWTIVMVDDDGNCADHVTSLTLVDGCPAISYDEYSNDDLRYARATTPYGNVATDWTVRASPDNAGYSGRYSSLGVVAGNPAISYLDGGTNQDLKYVRATDSTGSAWGTPITLDGAGVLLGSHTSLAVVSGFPAISYVDWENGYLKYIRANDTTGSAWQTPVTPDGSGNGMLSTTLLVVNGNPAISYYDNTNEDLMYVRALDAAGASWGTPVTVDSTGTFTGHRSSMAIVDGQPAIGYGYDDASSDRYLRFVRATDASGGSWGIPADLDSMGGILYASLAVVDGKPAIGYMNLDNDLGFIWALDASGSTWDTPEVVDGAMYNIGGDISLADVNGQPAMSYENISDDALMYAVKF